MNKKKIKSSPLSFKNVYSAIVYIILFSAVMLYAQGCSDNTVSPNGVTVNEYRGKTEYDFMSNPSLSILPGTPVYTALEYLASPQDTLPDTGERGYDIIRYNVTNSGAYTLRLDTGSYIKCRLVNASDTSAVLAELTEQNSFISLQLQQGVYILFIHSLYPYTPGLEPMTVFAQSDNLTDGYPGAEIRYRQNPQDENSILISTDKCIGCDFTEARLSGANFAGKDLRHSIFLGASLVSTRFHEADVSDCNFGQADMRIAGIEYAKFDNSIFYGADLSGVRNIATPGPYTHASFFRAKMERVKFNDADLGGCNFFGADLSYADFTGAAACSTSFCGANKTGWITNGTVTCGGTQCFP